MKILTLVALLFGCAPSARETCTSQGGHEVEHVERHCTMGCFDRVVYECMKGKS